MTLVSLDLAAAAVSRLPRQSIQTAAELVKVDASVADAHGNFLAGLSQQDFRILDNGIEQPVTFFVPVETPAQILVMIETGPAVYLVHNDHLAAAYALLDGLDPADQVALALYDESPRRMLAFTPDKSSLLSALSAIQYNIGMGDLNLYSSLSEVLDWLEPIGGKRAIVLLTTGLDSSQPSRWESLVGKLRRDDIVIFPVALGGSLRGPVQSKPQRLKKVPEGRAAENGQSPGGDAGVSFAKTDQNLRTLATLTGGTAYFPQSPQDFVSIYRRIAAALRHQYVLGFVPAHDGQYHSLSVEMASQYDHLSEAGQKKQQDHVFARSGYLAPAP